jgi:hypothetical protein
MNALNVDLARYAEIQNELDAFDALVESSQEAIAEETERLYREMYDLEQPLDAIAKQHIRDFAFKKAYFCVIRDKQEEIMNHEYRKFIKAMQKEFEQQAKLAGMTVEEYEEFELNEGCTAE